MQYVFNVFIGRFQPAHRAHIEIIRGALESKTSPKINNEGKNPNRVIVCVGSANSPRTPKNPFTANEREEMIRSTLTADENSRVDFAYISDSLYNNQEWAKTVQAAVDDIVRSVTDGEEDHIRLVGHKKDESSFYLDMFPQWQFIGITNIDDLHSTTIRDYFLNLRWSEHYQSVVDHFADDGADAFDEMCREALPVPIFDWLIDFRATNDAYSTLQEEFTYIAQYKEMWASAPYPPTFVTCDAVVIQSGHVLLITRKVAPGKGQLAIPGGFLDQEERIVDGVIRELREETRLKVPEPVLRGSIKDTAVFDHPHRSSRGRTITHAYLIELNPGPLPKVKGSDDAMEAQWYPINEVLSNESNMFEDHASIVKYFLGRA